jgi:hypothetical protein
MNYIEFESDYNGVREILDFNVVEAMTASHISQETTITTTTGSWGYVI